MNKYATGTEERKAISKAIAEFVTAESTSNLVREEIVIKLCNGCTTGTLHQLLEKYLS